ncbi:hypothetical protein KBD45_06085 [Candidatus Dojkabacteria bacterium]|nr:hypothetical protein [Candidatus Dojkabacteria bacterium]
MEFESLKENIYHRFGYSSVIYKPPIFSVLPKCYVNSGPDGIKVSHVRRDEYAMDFIAPVEAPIYPPAVGKIVLIEQHYDKASHSPGDGDKVNQIIVRTSRFEQYELKHIQARSCRFKVGDLITESDLDKELARVGLNGYYVEDGGVEFPPHLHFAVHGTLVTSNGFKEIPLRVRFDKFNIKYGIEGSVEFSKK